MQEIFWVLEMKKNAVVFPHKGALGIHRVSQIKSSG